MTETLFPCRFCGHQPIITTPSFSNAQLYEYFGCPNCLHGWNECLREKTWNRRNEKNNPFFCKHETMEAYSLDGFNGETYARCATCKKRPEPLGSY